MKMTQGVSLECHWRTNCYCHNITMISAFPYDMAPGTRQAVACTTCSVNAAVFYYCAYSQVAGPFTTNREPILRVPETLSDLAGRLTLRGAKCRTRRAQSRGRS